MRKKIVQYGILAGCLTLIVMLGILAGLCYADALAQQDIMDEQSDIMHEKSNYMKEAEEIMEENYEWVKMYDQLEPPWGHGTIPITSETGVNITKGTEAYEDALEDYQDAQGDYEKTQAKYDSAVETQKESLMMNSVYIGITCGTGGALITLIITQVIKKER